LFINKKPNLLFDALNFLELFENIERRNGIFFVTYNILKELDRQQIFNITLLVKHSEYKILHKIKTERFFSSFRILKYYGERQFLHPIELVNVYINNIKTTANVFKNIIYFLKIFKCCLYIPYYCLNNKIIKKINIFFSTNLSLNYDFLKYTHIKKYMLLYDIMTVLFPEYYTTFISTNDYINENADRLKLNKEYYYFFISECTKRDFLKYYSNIMDENKMMVTHIASAQDFYPDYDKVKLASALDKYKVKYKNNDKYIFSLCTLEPRKNLVFTVKCFVKFIKKHNIDNFYFYLGGGQWDFFINQLEEQIINLNEYRNKIVRLGYIDDEDVNILYSNSLFLTYISQYEGFGMPPLEAMQAGTPVITSNNSSLPEVVGDAAIMIDYNSEEQCIKAFEDLYFDENLRKNCIEKGLERAKLFSWEKTVDKISNYMLNSLPQK